MLLYYLWGGPLLEVQAYRCQVRAEASDCFTWAVRVKDSYPD